MLKGLIWGLFFPLDVAIIFFGLRILEVITQLIKNASCDMVESEEVGWRYFRIRGGVGARCFAQIKKPTAAQCSFIDLWYLGN